MGAELMRYASIAAGKFGPIYEAVLQIVPNDCFTMKNYLFADYNLFESTLNNPPTGEEVWGYTFFPVYDQVPVATWWVLQTRMQTDCSTCCMLAKCPDAPVPTADDYKNGNVDFAKP